MAARLPAVLEVRVRLASLVTARAPAAVTATGWIRVIYPRSVPGAQEPLSRPLRGLGRDLVRSLTTVPKDERDSGPFRILYRSSSQALQPPHGEEHRAQGDNDRRKVACGQVAGGELPVGNDQGHRGHRHL